MRIWIVNHYAIPPSSAGGTRHYNFAKQLQKRGHEVLLIAANYDHFSHTVIDTTKTYDVPFLWLPVPAYKGNTLGRFWNMLVFIKSLLTNRYLRSIPGPDVIIGSSPHLFAALGAELLARRLKKPFVLEVRDLWPESLVDLGRFTHKHPLIRMMKSIERYLYKRAVKVISLLPSSDNYLVQHGVNPSDIQWLPNSVDSESVPTDLVRVPHAKFTVMNAGAHGVANDLDTVLHAAKILQNKGLSDQIRICLVGEGPEKLRLKKLAESEQITMVEFFDAVPKNEVYAMLNQADAFLMLLKKSPVFRWGISPNKLFDYLIMARPIIFGVETPFNPVEKVNAGITVKPSDPESLAAAIHHLFLLPKEELANMGKRGKEFVLQHHDVKKLTTILENLLHTIHSESEPRPLGSVTES